MSESRLILSGIHEKIYNDGMMKFRFPFLIFLKFPSSVFNVNHRKKGVPSSENDCGAIRSHFQT